MQQKNTSRHLVIRHLEFFCRRFGFFGFRSEKVRPDGFRLCFWFLIHHFLLIESFNWSVWTSLLSFSVSLSLFSFKVTCSLTQSFSPANIYSYLHTHTHLGKFAFLGSLVPLLHPHIHTLSLTLTYARTSSLSHKHRYTNTRTHPHTQTDTHTNTLINCCMLAQRARALLLNRANWDFVPKTIFSPPTKKKSKKSCSIKFQRSERSWARTTSGPTPRPDRIVSSGQHSF